MGIGRDAKIAAWQSGVYEAKEAKAELLALTLDKSSGGFSPTTRYRDYAMSRTLIHWESQSSTRADGATGLRYRNHDREGRAILLFTRLRSDQRAFWFLGPATYRSHIGERPMAITWELHHPLPATSTLHLPPLSHSDEVYGSAQLSPIAIPHGVSQHPSRRRVRLAETTRKPRPLDE